MDGRQTNKETLREKGLETMETRLKQRTDSRLSRACASAASGCAPGCARSLPGNVTQAPVVLQSPLKLVQPQHSQGPTCGAPQEEKKHSVDGHGCHSGAAMSIRQGNLGKNSRKDTA